jgi:predicted nucleic acid-binding protein
MICVDASVAVKWVLDEESSSEALALYHVATTSREAVVAPPLLPIEVSNILFRYARRQPGFTAADALRLFDAFLAFPVEIHNPDDLHRDAVAIAANHGLPATYDAHYLALARGLGCDLWTDDRRLLRTVGGRLPFVRWIGDVEPPR